MINAFNLVVLRQFFMGIPQRADRQRPDRRRQRPRHSAADRAAAVKGGAGGGRAVLRGRVLERLLQRAAVPERHRHVAAAAGAAAVRRCRARRCRRAAYVGSTAPPPRSRSRWRWWWWRSCRSWWSTRSCSGTSRGACSPAPSRASRSSASGSPACGLLYVSGSGEPAAPRPQSLLRSCLAARSFPGRPPARGASRRRRAAPQPEVSRTCFFPTGLFVVDNTCPRERRLVSPQKTRSILEDTFPPADAPSRPNARRCSEKTPP